MYCTGITIAIAVYVPSRIVYCTGITIVSCIYIDKKHIATIHMCACMTQLTAYTAIMHLCMITTFY